jgi:hypothetical protein
MTKHDQTERSFWREWDSLGKLTPCKQQHVAAFETDLPTEQNSLGVKCDGQTGTMSWGN